MQFEKNDERIDLSLFETKMSPKQISQLKKGIGFDLPIDSFFGIDIDLRYFFNSLCAFGCLW